MANPTQKTKPKAAVPQRVLIIENDKSLLTLIQNYITKAGATDVTCIMDGNEALGLSETKPFDLVIMDWKMKNPSGLDLYNAFRANENTRELPIILISGFVTKTDIEIAQKDSNTKFLVKPFTEDILLSYVSRASKKPAKPETQSGDQRISGQGSANLGDDMSIVKGSGTSLGKNLVKIDGQAQNNDKGLFVDKGNGNKAASFEAGQKREKLTDMEIRQSRGEEGSEFSMTQKGPGQGSQMNITEKRGGPAGTEFSMVQKGSSGTDMAYNETKSVGQGTAFNMTQKGNVAVGGNFQQTEKGKQATSFNITQQGPKAGTDMEFRTTVNNNLDAASARQAAPKAGSMMQATQEGGKAGSMMQATQKGNGPGTAFSAVQKGNGPGTEFEAVQEGNNSLGSPMDIRQEGAKLKSGADIRQAMTTPNDADLDMSSGSSSGGGFSIETEGKKQVGVETGTAAVSGDGAKNTVVLSNEVIFGNKVNVVAPTKVLIIDGDPAIQNLIENYLVEIGASKFSCVSDGMQAWEAIKGGGYDLIVMDWRIKGMSGICFYNRLRLNPITHNIPVIVISGFAHKEDFRILGEGYYAKFVQKPLKIKAFDQALRETLRDALTHTTVGKMIGNLLDKISSDQKKVMSLVEGLLKNIQSPIIFVTVAGEYLLNKGEYDSAEKVFRIALRIDPSNVTAMSELSKIYHRTGRSQQAINLLAKADKLSPQSVERLCLMGEVGLTLQETDKARNYFQNALSIDKENPMANAGVTLSENLKEHSDTYNNSQPLALKFAASLNAVGVSYVKSNKIDKAIEQYKAAMCFIYDKATLARLQFNLGMAFLRFKKPRDAATWFGEATKNAGPEFKKAGVYREKIQKALGVRESDPEILAKLATIKAGVPPKSDVKAKTANSLVPDSNLLQVVRSDASAEEESFQIDDSALDDALFKNLKSA